MLRRLADGVYAAFSTDTAAATSNAGIVDLGDATLVFDAFLTPLAGAELRAAAETLTGRPVTHVVLSHYHNDHIRGTQAFGEATVISSARTKELIATRGEDERRSDAAGLPRRIPLWEDQLRAATDPLERRQLTYWIAYARMILDSLPEVRIVIPHRTFERRLTIEGTRRTVELVELAGHSPSDTVLALPADGVAFLADLLSVRVHPYLPDGDPDAWLEGLDAIGRFGTEQLVPGHGSLGAAKDLVRMREYITSVQEMAWLYADQGRNPDGAVPIPRTFRRWGFARFFAANVQFVWDRTRAAARP